MHRLSAFALVLVLLGGSALADSLFRQEEQKSGTLVSEKKARYEEGDIVTVLIREEIDALTVSDTNTKKESSVEAQALAAQNAFLVANKPGGLNILNPEELPNWQVEAENEAKTTGKTRRNSSLTTSVTCTVTEALENGNLKVEGEKQVTVNREDSLIKVSGVVRSRDVTPANTVQSTQLANAKIELRGKGPLWNNQRRGFFTKILDWFSPY